MDEGFSAGYQTGYYKGDYKGFDLGFRVNVSEATARGFILTCLLAGHYLQRLGLELQGLSILSLNPEP